MPPKRKAPAPRKAPAKKVATKTIAKPATRAPRQKAAARPVPPEEEDDEPRAEFDPIEMTERMNGLTEEVNGLADDLKEVKVTISKHFAASDQRLDDIFDLLERRSSRNTPLGTPSKGQPLGNTPANLIPVHLSWLDKTLLANIVSRKLEIKDLIKLIPEEDRPKGRLPAGLASGWHVDGTSGKTTIVNESSSTYEKDIPDFQTLMYALAVYGAVRSAYDVDNNGIGTAIFLYIKTFTRWF